VKIINSGGVIYLIGFDIEDEKFWEIGIEEVSKLFEEFKLIRKNSAEQNSK